MPSSLANRLSILPGRDLMGWSPTREDPSVKLRGPYLAALAALCVALAGCSASATNGRGHLAAARGSGGFPTSAAAPPSPVASSPAGLPSAPVTAGRLPLARIPVQQADVPPGWTASTGSSGGGGQMDAQLAACIGAKSSDADQIANVNGDTFDQGGSEISSSASRYKTQADVDNDVKLLSSPKLDACLTKTLREGVASSAPPGASVDSVSFHVSPGSHGGPSNVVGIGTGKLTLSADGASISAYLDIAFITGPRVEAEVDFTGLGAPIDKSLQRRLVAAVASRAARA
jgi:hypothetical protein